MSNLLRVVSGLALLALGYAFGHLSLTAAEPLPLSRAATFETGSASAPIEEALRDALLEQDPLTRVGQTARVLATIPPERKASVLATLDRVALAPGDIEVGLVAEWLGRVDPAAALEWARGELYGNHQWVLAAVIRTWARNDPQAAVDAFYAARGSLGQAATLSSLVLGWEEGNHPGLPEFMLSLEQGETPQVAIEALVRRKLARDGPEAVMRWAESLPADRPDVISRFKRNAMRRSASAIADYDPQLAMDWTTTFGEGEYGRGAYRRVAVRTARRDGVSTMRWLGSLPDGPQREGAVQEGYRQWLSADRKAAIAWLLAEPDAPFLDPAHDAYAQILNVTQGPEASLAWIEKIDGNQRRQRATVKMGRAWYQREPEAAKVWTENAPEWVSDDTLLAISDPAAAKAKMQAQREAKRAEYEARRAAAQAARGEE